jgi:hypothetical protein
VIFGTPTINGTSNFVILVADAASASASQGLSITIASNLAITTSTLPGGTVGAAYSRTLNSSGGTPPLTWSVSSGALPAGLGLNTSTGTISGTPSAVEATQFTIQAFDHAGATAFQSLSITTAPALFIVTTAMPGGTRNAPYSQPFTVTGGTAPLVFSIQSGSLPDGLSINSSNGVISGTPTSNGSSTFLVSVVDGAGQGVSQSITITIATALTLTSTSLPGGTVAVPYSRIAVAAGGTLPLTWSIPAGSLPAGLSLNTATGGISGTPSALGVSNFTMQVEDIAHALDSKALSITIGGPLIITTTSLPGGTANAPYSRPIAASGGTIPYTWSISEGGLPAGLNIDSSTGVISGTPSNPAAFSFKVQAIDSAGASTNSQLLSITVAPVPAITTASPLPPGTIGAAYSQTFAATPGTLPLTWSVTTGTLPSGLSLNTSTGVLSGTPSIAATANFTIQAADAAQATASKEFALTITALSITSTTLPGGTKGTAYSHAVASIGGVAPLTWSISAGALPAGLNINSTTGVITGTPTTVESSNFTVKVADSVGASTTQPLSIAIADVLKITTTTLPGGTATTGYSKAIATTGGTAPLTWSVTVGTLPVGLNLDSSAGTISGTPTTGGAANFTIKVVDSAGAESTQALAITISASLSITTSILPDGSQGISYTANLVHDGGTTPFVWSVTTGTLPAGLSLSTATGQITGSPTQTGSSTFSVQVVDSAGATA